MHTNTTESFKKTIRLGQKDPKQISYPGLEIYWEMSTSLR